MLALYTASFRGPFGGSTAARALEYACCSLLAQGLPVQSKSDLHAEIDALRQRVRDGRAGEESDGRSSAHGPSPRPAASSTDDQGSIHVAPLIPVTELEPVVQSLPKILTPPVEYQATPILRLEATVPQTLDNLTISADKIDSCFQLYGIFQIHISYQFPNFTPQVHGPLPFYMCP